MNQTLLAIALVATAFCHAPAAASPGPARPNILIVVADDMGFSDAGCYGGEIQTPNLDRLAAGGLRFTQFYSTARCWPSRTCILTGYYAQQVRMDPPQGRLPAWARVLPHYFKPLGYRCYQSGKWHLNGAPKVVADGGFDRSYKLDDHDRFFYPKSHTEDDRALPPVPPGSDQYVTRTIADHAIRCLKEHAEKHPGKPLLAYLAFTSPHFPLQAPAELIDRYRDRYRVGWDVIRQRRFARMREMGLVNCDLSKPQPDTVPPWNLSEAELQAQIGPGEAGRAVPWKELTPVQQEYQATKMAIHAAMVDCMDQQIGRVIGQLRAMGVLRDTIVLFVSDNGASAEQIIRGDRHDKNAPLGSGGSYLCLGPGWSTAANTPFRLHKHWVHEGGIASPLIVSWPARIREAGSWRRTPGHFIDLLPTLLELAAAPAPGDWNGKTPPPLPGKSLVAALDRDVLIPRDELYFHHSGHRAIRIGDWKLVSAAGKQGPGPWELYDLRTDRAESKDLSAAEPDRVRQMAARWQALEDEFRRQAGPPEPSAKKAGKKRKPAP